MPRRIPKAIPAVSIASIWNYATRELTDTLDPTAAAITTAVWAAVVRTLTASLDPTAAAIATAVWGTTVKNITEHEFEEALSSDETQATLNTTGSDQSLGSENITLALPTGMEVARVIALATIAIANRTANAQDIDFVLQVGGTPVFSQDDVVSFGDVQGSAVVPIAQDVTAIVTGDGVYALEAFAQISAAQNVTFTTQYYLFVQYRKS